MIEDWIITKTDIYRLEHREAKIVLTGPHPARGISDRVLFSMRFSQMVTDHQEQIIRELLPSAKAYTQTVILDHADFALIKLAAS